MTENIYSMKHNTTGIFTLQVHAVITFSTGIQALPLSEGSFFRSGVLLIHITTGISILCVWVHL